VSVRVGLTATVEATITEADTATALGSGDVSVLGTPRLLALAEAATIDALRGRLGAAQTSVGSRVRLAHRRPSGVGGTVRVDAVLVEVDGRSLRFEITALDGAGEPIADGEVWRAVVDRDRFLAQIPVVDRG
jgi:fluoroacetyl-CoA thioesterase